MPNRTASLALVVTCLIFHPLSATEKEARAILDRAIREHGGTEGLTKAQTAKRTDKGTQKVIARQEPFVGKVFRSLPDRLRFEIELGKTYKTVLVFTGDSGYQSDNGGPATKLGSQRIKELREELFLLNATTLLPLTKPGYTLTLLPPTKFDGEDAVGINVQFKGHADIKLYFSKRNGLLVRAERRVVDGGLLVDKEYVYSNHRNFGGVILPGKEVQSVNKNKVTEFTMTDYTFPEKFPPSVFAKP